jgi:hypothetical protein
MFDANASYIRKGRKFFVDIYYVSEKLKSKGINKGDLIYCHMLNETNEDPLVDMLVNGKMLAVCGGNSDEYISNWFVYAGRPDGTGFICEKTRLRAMDQMKLNLKVEK